MNIALFRHFGGMGDALIVTAILAGLRKKYNPEFVCIGSGDIAMKYLEMMPKDDKTILVNNPCEVPRMKYDLVLDIRSVYKIVGADVWMPDRDMKLAQRSADLIDMYLMKGAEVTQLFKDADCIGQHEFFEKTFKVPINIKDAFVPITETTQKPTKPYACLATGFGYKSVHKAYLPTRWAKIVSWLKNNGIEPVQLGSPTEHRLEGCTPAKLLPLPEQMAILRDADIAICSDGFLHHAAAVLGTPTVVLWGVVPYEVWGYRQQTNIISSKYQCLWNTHPVWFWDNRCRASMDAILPEIIIEFAKKMLTQNKTECILQQVGK